MGVPRVVDRLAGKAGVAGRRFQGKFPRLVGKIGDGRLELVSLLKMFREVGGASRSLEELHFGLTNVVFRDVLLLEELGLDGIAGLEMGQAEGVPPRQLRYPPIPRYIAAASLHVGQKGTGERLVGPGLLREVGRGEHLSLLLVAMEQRTRSTWRSQLEV